MRLVSIAPLLLFVCHPLSLAADSSTDREPSKPVTTRQSVFMIPFHLEEDQSPENAPDELQLSVSTDRGESWRVYQKVKPGAEHFLFRSDGDGEYWFLIHTVDRAGRKHPDRTDGPGLRVIVDTTRPELQLAAWQERQGQMAVRWEVTEENLAPQSVEVEYRTDAGQPWQSVAINLAAVDASRPNVFGEIAWSVPTDADHVEVRLTADDTAGNQAITHELVSLTGIAVRQSSPFDRPSSGSAVDTTSTQTQTARKTGPLDGSIAIEINPAVGNRYTPPRKVPVELNRATLPSEQRPRMVNSRLFEMEYHVDSIGPSGVRRIELWGTRDGGQSWTSCGADEDAESPMIVNVEAEGIYGLLITVTSGAGLGGEKPKRGDRPDFWIGVDTSKPSARVTSTLQGTKDKLGHLIVNWKVDDFMLDDRPVSIFQSQHRGGPWSPVATELDNSGRYDWLVGENVPQQVYLRLEARDMAGNLGIHELPSPITLDWLRPTVRIQDVRPVSRSAHLSHPLTDQGLRQ